MESSFIKADNVDGQWLSPIPSEREWQEQKLVEIFGHYPNASPRWQYMNGLIHIALEFINLCNRQELTKESELDKLKEAYSMGRSNKSIKEFNETFNQQEQ